MMQWWFAENERDGPWTVYSLGHTIAREGESKASQEKFQKRVVRIDMNTI
jgi:hypothetical protein